MIYPQLLSSLLITVLCFAAGFTPHALQVSRQLGSHCIEIAGPTLRGAKAPDIGKTLLVMLGIQVVSCHPGIMMVF